MKHPKRAALTVAVLAAMLADPSRAQAPADHAMELAQAEASALATAAGAGEATVIESITVIGSNRSDASGGLDASAPVHVISAAAILESGAATLNEVLSRLDPSFNFPQGQNAVKGQGVRSVELRGVSPAYTLVLVNGKRRNVSAELAGTDPWPTASVVDINAIPLAAVERIEVLKDGAAAQYGSDAIAGVVNIVLKKRTTGGDADLLLGRYTDGGGDTAELNLWKGFSVFDKGSLTLSANLVEAGQVDRTAPDWRQIFPVNDARNGVVHPDANWVWGQSARKYGSALGNFELPVAAQTQVYGWINWADKWSNNYVNPERVVATNNNPTAATLQQFGPTNPNQINQYIDPWIDPSGEQPNLTYISNDWAGALGARSGDIDDLGGRWDVAVSDGSNTTRRYAYSTLNPSWGAASPTQAYLGSWKSHLTSATADGVKSLSTPWLSQPLLLEAGALFRHEYWGVGDIGDAWTYTPGALTQSGILTVGELYSANPGFIPAGLSASQIAGIKAQSTAIPTIADLAGILPTDAKFATRNVRGVYLGTEADLTSRWQLGTTVRYENYSDFGNSLTGKLTNRYQFSPAFALRGTVSSGFHAPSIAELAYQSTGFTGNLVNGGGSSAQVLGKTRQFAPGDPLAAAFGARPLKPETSDNFSLGAVWKANQDTSLTVDAFYLKIRGVITASGSLSGNGTGPATVPAGQSLIGSTFAAEGLPGYTTVSYFLNAWDQTTRGVDAVAHHHIDHLGPGSLEVLASASFIDTQVNSGSVRSTASVRGNSFLLIAPAQVRDAQYGTPHNKLLLNGRYNLSAWSVNGTFTKYGQYRYDANGTNGIHDQVFAPETYFDLATTYRVTARASATIGAQNLFNRYPDAYDLGNRQSGVNKFSFIAPNGASGRFVYLAGRYSFD